MEKEAIEQEVMRAGWEVDYGFLGQLIIGNAGDLSILTPSQAWQGAPPVYELYDAQRNIACRTRVIPTPLRAEMLLEEHGEYTPVVDDLEWDTSSMNQLRELAGARKARAPSYLLWLRVQTKGGYLSMYWSNQEIDYTLYPPCCPDCYELKWLDYDWETGLGYCIFCGWYPDNGDGTVSSSGAGEG